MIERKKYQIWLAVFQSALTQEKLMASSDPFRFKVREGRAEMTGRGQVNMQSVHEGRAVISSCI